MNGALNRAMVLILGIGWWSLCPTNLPAQPYGDSVVRPPSDFVDVGYGVYAFGDYAFHKPSFSRLEGVASCCPGTYPATWSSGFEVGGLYRRAFGRSFVGEVRLGYARLPTTFGQTEPHVMAAGRQDANGVPVQTFVDFVYSIGAWLNRMDLSVHGGYRLRGALHVYGGLGLGVLFDDSLWHRETINSSDGIQFIDSTGTATPVWNAYTGPIIHPSRFQVGLMLGLGYSFPLDRFEHIFLEPQFFYRYGLTSLIHQDDGLWRVHALSLGVEVRYAPLGIPPPPPPGPPPMEEVVLRPD